MGWPEALVSGLGIVQVCFLAWIASRQQQVKRALNGHADDVTDQLVRLREDLDITPRVSVLRNPGVLEDAAPSEHEC